MFGSPFDLVHLSRPTNNSNRNQAPQVFKPLVQPCTHHSKADISLFEGGAVVGSVSGDRDHFSVGVDLAVDDAANQVELVDRLRPGEDAQPRPDQVELLLRDLEWELES